MSADILLYALIAAGLVFWLRSILGTQDDDDDHDHHNDKSGIFSDTSENDRESILPLRKSAQEQENNVVRLNAVVGGQFDLPHNVRIENKTAENILEDITQTYENFDLGHFAEGAQQAFAMIVESFAEGDRATLKNLLSDSVYNAFDQALKEREARNETVETQIKAVRKADIIEAVIKDETLFITVRFTAQETCVIRDSEGEIISGDPDKTTEMVDVWVFGRDIKAEGPEWLVYETRDDEVEDHKTPLPESHKKDDQ